MRLRRRSVEEPPPAQGPSPSGESEAEAEERSRLILLSNGLGLLGGVLLSQLYRRRRRRH